MAADIESGELSFTFKDFALPIHAPRSNWSAEAAWCAADQGTFWGYHDYLFNNQKQWTKDDLKAYAKAMSLDTKQFNDCVDSRKYEKQVKDATDEATKLNLQGTPSFFINGKPLPFGTTPQQALAAIHQALGK